MEIESINLRLRIRRKKEFRKIHFLFLEEKESTMMQESASRTGLGADKEKWRERQGSRGQIPVFKKD